MYTCLTAWDPPKDGRELRSFHVFSQLFRTNPDYLEIHHGDLTGFSAVENIAKKKIPNGFAAFTLNMIYLNMQLWQQHIQ